jgi:SAM-dependent methyltransferase
MAAPPQDPSTNAAAPSGVLEGNRRAYDDRWGSSRRIVEMRPDLWRDLSPHVNGGRALEIGPGLRPTLPVRGAYFVEISPKATTLLRRAGGRAVQVADGHLPFSDAAFDTVLGLEVLEHVERDEDLIAEMRRVLRPGGIAVVSVPLDMALWSELDVACSHVRRYDRTELLDKLRAAGFEPIRYSVRTGRHHAPRFQRQMLERFPKIANWSLQHVVFPLETSWRRRFGSIRWRDADDPVPQGVSGMTVLAALPAARAEANGRAATG